MEGKRLGEIEDFFIEYNKAENEYNELKEELDRLLDSHLKITYNERADLLERILDLIFN